MSSREFQAASLNAVALAQEVNALPENERTQVLQILEASLSAEFRARSLSPSIVPSSGLLPERVRRAKPKQQWLDRDKSLKLSPVDFILQTYGDRLGRGFTQADLKACDKSCYDALHQWLRRTDPVSGEPNRIPPTVDLPSVEDWNARRVRQLRAHPESIDDDERQRLYFIIAGRAYRGNEIK